MASTLLQLVQQGMGEMGLSVPTTVVGNTNQDVIQCLSLINAVGYEMIRKHQWQWTSKVNLFQTNYVTTTGNVTANSAIITNIPSTSSLSTYFTVTGTGILNNSQVSSVDSSTQITMQQQASTSGTGVSLTFSQTKYAMPSDFDRQIDRTHWDKTQHWQMIGPETPQQWEWLTSGYISTGPIVRYRIFGNTFQIWPPQGTQHYLGFEYISNAWANSAAGVAKSSFTVDTDTCTFPDRLMVLGLKNKYYQAKGLGDVFARDYEAEYFLAVANDAGSQTLSMNPRVPEVLLGWNNIPDSGYGA